MINSFASVKSIALFLGISLLCLSGLTAQECTVRSTNPTTDFSSQSGTVVVSQVFTACTDGPIKSFTFSIKNDGYEAQEVQVSIAEGILMDGASISFTELGSFNIVPQSTATEAFTFVPTNDFQLRAGVTYTISMFMNIVRKSDFRGQAGARSGGFTFLQTIPSDASVGAGTISPVAIISGPSLTQGNGRMMGALAFNLVMGNGAPIPTMNQWGLMIFGLLLLNISLVLIYRLKRQGL